MAVQVWSAGIDVGKGAIDIGIWGKPDAMHHTTRDDAGLHEMIGWLRDHDVVRVGLEASGGYEREIADTLEDAGFEVHVLNPRQVRRFAEHAPAKAGGQGAPGQERPRRCPRDRRVHG